MKAIVNNGDGTFSTEDHSRFRTVEVGRKSIHAPKVNVRESNINDLIDVKKFRHSIQRALGIPHKCYCDTCGRVSEYAIEDKVIRCTYCGTDINGDL